jgi:hypothetical protein
VRSKTYWRKNWLAEGEIVDLFKGIITLEWIMKLTASL